MQFLIENGEYLEVLVLEVVDLDKEES